MNKVHSKQAFLEAVTAEAAAFVDGVEDDEIARDGIDVYEALKTMVEIAAE